MQKIVTKKEFFLAVMRKTLNLDGSFLQVTAVATDNSNKETKFINT
jgi:hypothetical protein